jgi:hypothetical protein
MAVTMTIIAEVLFGADLSASAAADLGRTISDLMEQFSRRNGGLQGR